MAEAVLSRGYSQVDEESKPPRTYKDVEWAFAFVAHLVGVVAIAAAFLPELLARSRAGATDDADASANATADASATDPQVVAALNHALSLSLPFVGVGIAVGLAWAVVWITIVQAFAKQLIYVSLFAPPVFFGLTALSLVGSGAIMPALLVAMLGGFFLFYALWILRHPWRVQFAQLCLTTVSAVIKKYPGTYMAAFASIVPATVYHLGLFAAFTSTYSYYSTRAETITHVDEQGHVYKGKDIGFAGKALMAFLALSLYWSAQVINNVVHVTNSGVVATWYFMQHNMPASPTAGSLRRALSTSFGSICLGSLLVALVQLLRNAVENAKRNSGESPIAMVILCCVSCFVGILEWLLELFNHWAFVQVAIYGKDFKTAAKDTMQLVKSKGLDGLVNMNLTGAAVGLGATIGALLTGGVVALASYHPLLSPAAQDSGLSDSAKSVYTIAFALVIVVSVLLAIFFASMVSSTVTSGTTTLFVCFAEDPAALQASNRELHDRFEQITAEYLAEHPYDGPMPSTNGHPAGPPVAQHMYGSGGPPHAYAVPARGNVA